MNYLNYKSNLSKIICTHFTKPNTVTSNHVLKKLNLNSKICRHSVSGILMIKLPVLFMIA